MFRKVAVAMSGGVDSAVAALILKQRDHIVSGVYMKNWDVTDELGHCTNSRDEEDARYVCQHLSIPFHKVNFVQEYWNHVFMDFITDYQNGITPNPDMLCNKFIKFDRLVNYAISDLGFDCLATGHYANSSYGPFLENVDSSVKPRLLRAIDTLKDQTFFLSRISYKALTKTMFPLAHLFKSEVKEIAKNNNLSYIANKKESRGICFIGPRHFQQFISEYVDARIGCFIDIDTEKVVGKHNGIHQWTVGQKCRIGGLREPYYVVEKLDNGDITVASGHDHPSLYNDVILASDCHWIHSEPFDLSKSKGINCSMRFQHGKPLTGCKITIHSDTELKVILNTPLRALTPGQYAVFYLGDECLGSARILLACKSKEITDGHFLSHKDNKIIPPIVNT